MKTAKEVLKILEMSFKFRLGQKVQWIEPTDKYTLKAEIIRVQPAGSPGMGMGAKPLDQDIYTLRLLDKSPRGNQHLPGETVFATASNIK